MPLANRGKHKAIDGMVARLQTINGAPGGYNHNLGGRVYTTLITPEEQTDPTLPYCCVILVDDNQSYDHQDTWVETEFDLAVFGYVAETSPAFMNSQAVRATAKLHDDIVRAILGDLSLGGAVRDTMLRSASSSAGVRATEPDYGEVVVIPRVKQVFTRDELAA